jgi:hypothetical protein
MKRAESSSLWCRFETHSDNDANLINIISNVAMYDNHLLSRHIGPYGIIFMNVSVVITITIVS